MIHHRCQLKHVGQSVFLSMLASAGAIQETQYFTVSNISAQAQSLLICMEMVIAAFVHIVCFSAEEYEGERTTMSRGIRDMVVPMDLIRDTRDVMLKGMKPQQTQLEMQVIKSSTKEQNDDKNNKNNHNMDQPHEPLIDRAEDDGDLGGDMQRRGSADGEDIEFNEIDEDIDGVGTIRINPRLGKHSSTDNLE